MVDFSSFGIVNVLIAVAVFAIVFESIRFGLAYFKRKRRKIITITENGEDSLGDPGVYGRSMLGPNGWRRRT